MRPQSLQPARPCRSRSPRSHSASHQSSSRHARSSTRLRTSSTPCVVVPPSLASLLRRSVPFALHRCQTLRAGHLLLQGVERCRHARLPPAHTQCMMQLQVFREMCGQVANCFSILLRRSRGRLADAKMPAATGAIASRPDQSFAVHSERALTAHGTGILKEWHSDGITCRTDGQAGIRQTQCFGSASCSPVPVCRY